MTQLVLVDAKRGGRHGVRIPRQAEQSFHGKPNQ